MDHGVRVPDSKEGFWRRFVQRSAAREVICCAGIGELVGGDGDCCGRGDVGARGWAHVVAVVL